MVYQNWVWYILPNSEYTYISNWVRYIIIGQGISELGMVYHNWDRYYTELGYGILRIWLWCIRIGIWYIRILSMVYHNWVKYLSELGKVYHTQLGKVYQNCVRYIRIG